MSEVLSVSSTQNWSLTLSSQSSVGDGFERLRKAIDEYNTHASRQKRELVNHQNTRLEEVRKLAERIQADCDRENAGKKVRSTLKNGLRKFCETSLYYSTIIDVLIQQNPEWVSLAWGAVKFLLMVPIEYQRVKENIATHLGSLGEKFAVVHMFTEFFPSANIVEAAAAMYRSFTEFLEMSIRWLSDNQFKRIIKSTFRPFDTSLKPILEKIEQSYGVLKEHVKVQKLIRDYQLSQQHHQDLATLKISADGTDEKLTRVLQILEGLILDQNRQNGSQLSKPRPLPMKQPRQKPQVFLLPSLGSRKIFSSSLEPMEDDLGLMQSRQALSPILQTYEGTNILQRDDFRNWISSASSGVLWVDGYEKLGRPSWLGDLALRVTQAAHISGNETLYTFNSLRLKTTEAVTPIGLLQRLSNHLLYRYPEIYEVGDTDLLSPEIFLAAETDVMMTWNIFRQCLAASKPTAMYVVVEAVDEMNMISNNREEFQLVLQLLSQLGTPGAVKNKIIKIMITSTKPNAGFDEVFSEPKTHTKQDTHVLIRVSPAAARSRKQRSIPGVKRRVRIPSNSHAMAGLSFQCEKILISDDFVPEPEEMEPEDISGVEGGFVQHVESDDDFDIFDSGFSQKDKEKSLPSSVQEEELDEIRSSIAINSAAMRSDGSLDIFGEK
ncbi:hypothetical protein M426DRAFT_325500 [Hypoxylon sp. CI-4A]|nr:hypothetical protein M426DRAFT_325500 [Hypoxylon sp. CI-4A]